MVSKRKRGEEEEVNPVTTSTRSTRSSTRQTKSTTATASKRSTRKKTAGDPVDEDSTIVASQPKKSRVTKTTEETMRTTGKSSKSKQNDVSGNVGKDLNGPSAHKQDSEPPPSPKTEPYNAANVQSLFNTYADKDDPDTINAENFERLCTNANVPMEGPMPLILLWLTDAQDLGTIKRDKWTGAMQNSQISSLATLRIFLRDLEELLLTNKPPIPQTPAAPIKGNKKPAGPPPYDRTQYSSYAQDRGGTFHKLYSALFTIAKSGQSRNIDVEIAKAFWSVLLAPQYPIITEVVEYITEKGTYKAVNKDVWSMMLEFCKTVNLNLDNYEADGAWPTLIDDFVAWKQDGSKKKPVAPTTD